MRSFLSRRAMLAVASVLALAAAGIAVAGPAPSSMSLVSATFWTGAPTNSHSQTCTAANNDQITVTEATYTGTASSADSRLAGPITIDVQSVYDATANLGTLAGDVRIDSTATPTTHFHAGLTAVDVNGNTQGWVAGHAGPGAQITGAFAASFGATTGFANGTIGATTGSATNPAVITSGSCQNPPNPPQGGHGPKGPKFWGQNDQGKNHRHDR
jgi:hypothetical protein